MGFSVVLAEDDPDIQLVARLALKRAGFTVTVVANGLEALAEVRVRPPDVVLLDWMMPELDGPETCRQLKSDPETAAIPVIFLTAKSQEAEIQRGLSLGAAGYVTKPFDALALGQQVKDLVSRAAAVRLPGSQKPRGGGG
jgi:CheY-like chemotaxis protein